MSVVDVTAPSVQLLRNPGFENSTTSPPVGWVVWCSYTCGSANGSMGLGAANCQGSTNNCWMSPCTAPGIEFIGQSFPALIGNKYTVSFWLNLGGGGVATTNRFYFDII